MALTLRADAILCLGTWIRAANGEQHRVQSLGSLGLAIHFGGREEGTPIEVLAARSYSGSGWQIREFVKEIRAALDRVAGWSGAIWLRTGGEVDMVLVCFNAPPTSGNRRKMRTLM